MHVFLFRNERVRDALVNFFFFFFFLVLLHESLILIIITQF